MSFFSRINWTDVAKEMAEYAPVIAAALDNNPEVSLINELGKKITGYKDATPSEMIRILRNAKKSNSEIINKLKNLEPEMKERLNAQGINVDKLLVNFPSHTTNKPKNKNKFMYYFGAIAAIIGILYELINIFWK
jgi:hypothetical protein